MELIIRDKYIFLQGEKQFGSDMCMVSQLNQKRAHLDLQKKFESYYRLEFKLFSSPAKWRYKCSKI